MDEEGDTDEGQQANTGVGLGAQDAVDSEAGAQSVEDGSGEEDAAIAEVEVFEHGAGLAFHGCNVCGWRGVVCFVRAILPMPHAVCKEFDKARMGVEAGDLFVGFAAGLDEGLATLDRDFLKGFQAVGGKGGADNFDVFVAVFGELFEGLVGVGLEPGFASKP